MFLCVNIVICRTSSDKWSPICSDNWDNSWSDLACRQLGYSGQLNTEATYDYNLTDEDFWYRNGSVSASPQPVQKAGVISGTNKCPSKEKVDVVCQNFGMVAIFVFNFSIFVYPRMWEVELNRKCGECAGWRS